MLKQHRLEERVDSPRTALSLEVFLKKLKSIYLAGTLLTAALSLSAQVSVDKTSLSFSGQTGGQPVQQTINVSSTTGSSVFATATILEQTSSQVSWLRFNGTCSAGVTGSTGSTPFALTITADPSCVPAGTYTGSVSINPQVTGASQIVIPITFTVSALAVSPASVNLSYQTGSALPNPTSLAITGPNSAFTAAAATTNGGNWLNVAPTSGAITGGSGAVAVILDPNVTPTLAAGTYNGTVTITPSGASNNTPVIVPVTLTVTVAPPVTISGSTLQINYQLGGANNLPQQVLTIATTSTQALTYGLSSTVANNPSGRNWIVINPSSGTIPANGSVPITVSYDTTANLPAGNWTGTVTLFTPGGSPQQQNITVNLLVSSSPLLSVPSAGLSFIYELNSGVNPPAQSVVTTSTAVAAASATGQIPVTAAATTSTGGNWLTVTPSAGTTGSASPFSVAVNASGLTPGKYQGTVTFTGVGAGNGPQSVPVTLTVAADASLVTNLTALTFETQIGQNSVATSQTSQTVTVSSSTGATLSYVATAATSPAGGTWLLVSGNTTANTNSSFTVTVVPTGLAAGTYSGTITITATNPATGNAALNSPLTIPVSYYVSNSPLLVVTLPGNPPSQPVLTAQVNGAAPATLPVTLNSTTPGSPLPYTVTFTTNSGGSWLFATPQSGTTTAGSNVISIGALPGILSPGTYTGTVTITSAPSGATVANSPYTIPVTFNVTAGTISLSQSTLNFSQTLGGSAPVAQTVILSGNGQTLNYQAVASTNASVNWLSVSPTSGNTSSNATLTVAVDGSKLSPGNYTGLVTVTAPNASNSPATVTVNLTVSAGTISANQTVLNFQQVQNSAAPASQTIAVTSSPNSVNFSVVAATTTGGNWLTAGVVTSGSTTPSSTGSTPGSIQVTANAGTLSVGQYAGTVTITSNGAAGSPISIPVMLNVVAPQTLTVSPSGTLAFTYITGTAAPAAQQLQVSSSGTSTFTATAKTTDGASWLAVTPASGSLSATAAPLSVQVTPTSLVAGNYTGTITIASPNAAAPVVVNVTLAVTAIPTPVIIGIRNAASGFTGSISPGENIVIFGSGIGPASLAGLTLTSAGKVSTNIGNTQVFFDSVAAPMVYASATQTSVMVPYEITGRPTTTITVVYSGATSAPLTYTVVPTVPGIYTQNLTGSGPGSILNQDFSPNGPTNGESAGRVVAVYMTGEGVTSPQSVTGGVATASTINNPVLPVTATVGGVAAQVQFAGSAPGLVYGVLQVNVQIPAGVTPGPQPIVINLGTTGTQAGVTVQVK